jgi:hypothetical protein
MGKLNLSAESFRWGAFVRDQQTAREQQTAAYGYAYGSWVKQPLEIKILRKKTLAISWHWQLGSHFGVGGGGGPVTRHQKVELDLADVTDAVAGLTPTHRAPGRPHAAGSAIPSSGTVVTVTFSAGACRCFEGQQDWDRQKQRNGRCRWEPAGAPFASGASTQMSFELTNTEAKIRKDLAALLSIGAPAPPMQQQQRPSQPQPQQVSTASSFPAPVAGAEMRQQVAAPLDDASAAALNKRPAPPDSDRATGRAAAVGKATAAAAGASVACAPPACKKPRTGSVAQQITAAAALETVAGGHCSAAPPPPPQQQQPPPPPPRPRLTYIHAGDVRFMKVGELKALCAERGLFTGGSKADKICRLSVWLMNNDQY